MTTAKLHPPLNSPSAIDVLGTSLGGPRAGRANTMAADRTETGEPDRFEPAPSEPTTQTEPAEPEPAEPEPAEIGLDFISWSSLARFWEFFADRPAGP